MTKQPLNENLDQAYSTVVPVVTALLASLSVALLIVPLAAPTPPSKELAFPPIRADQIVVSSGIVAATLFVAASVCCIYGAATTEPSAKTNWFHWANRYWVFGLPLLLLTTGALAYRQVSWLLPASALVAAFVLFTGDPRGYRWLAISVGLGLLAMVFFAIGLSI